MMRYRWIITRDVIEPRSAPNAFGVGHNDAGTRIRITDQRDVDAAVADMPYDFQLLDDDGELYFEGRSRDVGEDSERAFAPLDWAAANDGCTIMHWRPVGETSWRIL